MKKITISVLTRGYDSLDGYDNLIHRNKCIREHILSKTNLEIDCIIFHEGNITDSHQKYISDESQVPLIFRNVKECGDKTAFDNSRDVVNSELCPPTELSSQFPLGYKHMCYFWSINLFDYLSDYEYVIRIDEDVFIQEIDIRILESIIDQKIKFAAPYICPFLDHPDVMIGLEKLTKEFVETNNLKINGNISNVYAPNTNVMILNLDYYRNHTIIQNYLVEIKESHGIYSNRWGDATVWGIITQKLQEDPFYLCDDVVYFHDSHKHLVNKKAKNV
jgi:hypothetical protein